MWPSPCSRDFVMARGREAVKKHALEQLLTSEDRDIKHLLVLFTVPSIARPEACRLHQKLACSLSQVGPVRCEHAKALRSLVRQAALLGRRGSITVSLACLF